MSTATETFEHREVRVRDYYTGTGDFSVMGDVYGVAVPFDPNADTQQVHVKVGNGTFIFRVSSECVTVLETSWRNG